MATITTGSLRKSQRIAEPGRKAPKVELYSEQLYAIHTSMISPKMSPKTGVKRQTLNVHRPSATPYSRPPSNPNKVSAPSTPTPISSPTQKSRTPSSPDHDYMLSAQKGSEESPISSTSCSVTVEPIKIAPLRLPDILSPRSTKLQIDKKPNNIKFLKKTPIVKVKAEVSEESGGEEQVDMKPSISELSVQAVVSNDDEAISQTDFFKRIKKEVELEVMVRRFVKIRERELMQQQVNNEKFKTEPSVSPSPSNASPGPSTTPPTVVSTFPNISRSSSPVASPGALTLDTKRLEELMIKSAEKDPLTGKLKCPICGKLITRAFGLRVHLRVHTGEKPHRCEMCNATFADRSNLQSHIHTHKETRPHVCLMCNKEFALKSYLKKHMLLHGPILTELANDAMIKVPF